MVVWWPWTNHTPSVFSHLSKKSLSYRTGATLWGYWTEKKNHTLKKIGGWNKGKILEIEMWYTWTKYEYHHLDKEHLELMRAKQISYKKLTCKAVNC